MPSRAWPKLVPFVGADEFGEIPELVPSVRGSLGEEDGWQMVTTCLDKLVGMIRTRAAGRAAWERSQLVVASNIVSRITF